MNAPFISRLTQYYRDVAERLRASANSGAIFRNPSDRGASREHVYVEFLRQHAPSKCNVSLGGFLFDEAGNESRQIDVLVVNDTALQFNLHNKDGAGKTFSSVDGAIAVASIKSTLDKRELIDSLDGFASIPATPSLDGRVPPFAIVKDYDDWPYKILYANDCISANTLMSHLQEYYEEHSQIPFGRRPNMVYVPGKACIMRVTTGAGLSGGITPPLGSFVSFSNEPDIQAICWTMYDIQIRAIASTYIFNSSLGLATKVMQSILSGSR